ncbi:hypothetical protein PFICI_00584 [Pestalotiopsis fici W106-1]|uniref:Uncharacterized protein n=1 Tax=Pestalotiopsis fici (strain W106-1 / CGMCC3.15140) TaxID=1229662 RepID=W3XND3_PESFW|nr:uncharacterized protein PFICI_00584 [Pestalotiopsis fici W106-1]ETS86756.1 hypothetical protein PFICI_00584 [Pestalotiopsis fici W106-1]
MDINHIFLRSFGDCPAGSSFTSCGGPEPYWRGCCSSHGCSDSEGCPADAKISIQVSSGENWPSFTTMTTSHKASSDVGAPMTGESPTPTTSMDTSTSTTEEPSKTPAETAHVTSNTIGSLDTAATPTGATVDGSGRLSPGAIAGISVGSGVGAIALLIAIFLLFRRRKHAKRMPSYRDNLHGEFNEKEPPHEFQSSAARRNGDDVFAAFGGRATSFESSKAPQTITPSASRHLPLRQDEVSPVSSPCSPAGVSYVSPITPQFTSPIQLEGPPPGNRDTVSSRAPSGPAHLESSCLYHELDSADTARPNTFELPTPTPPMTPQTAQGLCHEAKSDHPEALMPGAFPNVVKDAQRQKFTRVQSGDAAVVSIGGKSQHSRPGSFDHPASLRATMNATADDVKSNRHVNSWAHL